MFNTRHHSVYSNYFNQIPVAESFIINYIRKVIQWSNTFSKINSMILRGKILSVFVIWYALVVNSSCFTKKQLSCLKRYNKAF